MGGRLSFGVKSVVAFAAYQVATAALESLMVIDLASFPGWAAGGVLSVLVPAVLSASLWSVAAIGLMRRREWARWVAVVLVMVTNPVTVEVIRESTGLAVPVPGLLGWVVWAPIMTVYLLRSRRFGEPGAAAGKAVGRVAPADLFLASLVLVGAGFVAVILGAVAGIMQMDRPGGADAVTQIVALGGVASFLVGAAAFIATIVWVIVRTIDRTPIRPAGQGRS